MWTWNNWNNWCVAYALLTKAVAAQQDCMTKMSAVGICWCIPIKSLLQKAANSTQCHLMSIFPLGTRIMHLFSHSTGTSKPQVCFFYSGKMNRWKEPVLLSSQNNRINHRIKPKWFKATGQSQSQKWRQRHISKSKYSQKQSESNKEPFPPACQ